MQDVFIEYLVKKQKTAKTACLKVLIALAAVVVALGAMFLSGILQAFTILGALIAVCALYGAYHLITSMNVEYEYSVTNGELDVDQIIAQRKRKRLVTVNCREVEAFGKYRSAEHQQVPYGKRIIACDHPQSPELWYAVAHLPQSGKTLVVFNANEKMLKGIQSFLPPAVRRETFPAE